MGKGDDFVGRYGRDIVLEVCKRFLDDENTAEIRDAIKDRVPEITREQIYPLLRQAYRLGILVLNPPIDEQLAGELAKAFRMKEECVRVVDAVGFAAGDGVAETAAKWVAEILTKLGRGGQSVTLGFGPGRASRDLARHLNHLLMSMARSPKLDLVAIAAGGVATAPEFTASSIMGQFNDDNVASRTAMFAPNLIKAGENAMPQLQKTPGAREAFLKKDAIQVCVSGIGAFNDSHDLFSQSLLDLKKFDSDMNPDRILTKGIGNVMYRPFNEDGPMQEREDEPRAATLFELQDFAAMAREKDRHVILMLRNCGGCLADLRARHIEHVPSRAPAVFELLNNPKLRCFSEIVIEKALARDVLRLCDSTAKQG